MSLYASAQPIIQRLPLSLQTRIAEWQAAYGFARGASEFVSVPKALARSLFLPRRRVLCKQWNIRPGTVLSKLFAVNGYRPVFDGSRPHHFAVHRPSPKGLPVINGDFVDNQKTRVANAWAEAAGYELSIDPTEYPDKMVEKSDDNATHDGRVVAGPIQPDEIVVGKVYQRLIDNSDGDEVVDLRIPLYGGRVPFVYVKRRPLTDRFSNTNTSVEIRETADVFSDEELEALSRFAEKVGLDFGEADVLRDNGSGRIYVVDSTNGPAGPPNGLPHEEATRALSRLALALDRTAENALRRRLAGGQLCANLCEGRLRPMQDVLLNGLAIKAQAPEDSEEVDLGLLSRP